MLKKVSVCMAVIVLAFACLSPNVSALGKNASITHKSDVINDSQTNKLISIDEYNKKYSSNSDLQQQKENNFSFQNSQTFNMNYQKKEHKQGI